MESPTRASSGLRVLIDLPANDFRATIVEALQACPAPRRWYVDTTDVGQTDQLESVAPFDVMVTRPRLDDDVLGGRLRDVLDGGGGVVAILDHPLRGAWPHRCSAVLTGEPVDEVMLAIEATAHGATWISARAWFELAGNRRGGTRERLTPAERETLRLLADGLTDSQIAAARTVSVTTVRHHMRNLRGKTGCASRHQLIAMAFRTGICLPSVLAETVRVDGAR